MNKLQHLQYLNFRKPSRYADNITAIQAKPSLDLNFARNKSLMDNVTGNNLVTFTRASSGTFVDGSGVLQTASTDIPRFDHNPTTGESLGLLIEEQRTNLIRNNTMGGAVVGSPGTLPTNWGFTGGGLGTLSSEVVATGISNGIDYIDIRISGTTSTTSVNIRFENSANITTVLNDNWTNSTYVAMIGGSTSNITGLGVGLIERTSAGAFLIVSTTAIRSLLTSTLTRYTHTRTASQATVAQMEPNIQFSFSSGVAIDITLRIGLPQIEKALFATSVIKTTGSNATRNADVASITGTNFSSWYRQDEGTLFAENIIAIPASGGNQFVFRSSDNGYNNIVALNVQSGGFGSLATSAGGVFDGVAASALALSANTVEKFAGAYAVNNLGVSLNGATAVTDTSATIPTALTRADIGSNHVGTNRVKAARIRRLAYWPQRLSNENLQRITQ